MLLLVKDTFEVFVPKKTLITCQAFVQSSAHESFKITSPGGAVTTISATGAGGEFTQNFKELAAADGVYTFKLGTSGGMVINESVIQFGDTLVARVYTAASNDGGWGADNDFNDIVGFITVYYKVR